MRSSRPKQPQRGLEIGFDWLCFSWPQRPGYLHNPFLIKVLRSFWRL